jgi:hypothetical protein
MDYYSKYLKYNNKNYFFVGGKYNCIPKNKFNDICIENENGKYKNKESCINDCEGKYFKEQLVKENLYKETQKFYNLIKELINDEKIDVYIKGGNVIGLKLLRMIYDAYKDDDEKFEKYFYEFLKLDLIKDWDFASYTKKEITNDYKDKLDKISKKYNLVPRAKTFILYQTKRPILLDDKPLFEISILDKEEYSSMEIPLTTMKFKLNEHTIKYVFAFARSFISYKKEKEFDMILLKRLISKVSILIHPHQNGFYNDPDKFDKGCINDNLMNFIKKFSNNDVNLSQFLSTQLEDPFRLLYRLPEKNIPKTIKIWKFIREAFCEIIAVDWLFDPDFIIETINSFTKALGDKIDKIYDDDGIDGVVLFFNGVRWGRIDIEYDKLLTNYGKELLNNILGNLMKKMGKETIKELDKKNKLFSLLQKIK